jgi:hypothetical protein
LVDRRDLRVVMNRFLLYPHGLIFSIDLATGSESQPRSASAAGVGFDDVMSVAVRFPEGLEAVTCLIVPGRRPGFAIGVSYLGSGESDPGATCLRVLAAEGTDDTASYTMWLWPQPPGVFEVELDWSAGGLQLATMVDLPWIPSVWGPTVLT